MNIAVVGAGTRCLALLKALRDPVFESLQARVVAVADERDQAICMEQARREGLVVTKDYNDLLQRDDIDLIIEMTGKEEIFYDILRKKKKTVRAFDNRTAQLFWEISKISALQEKTKQELAQAKNLYNVFINELMEEDVMVISPSYEIIDINETLSKKIGLDKKQVIGRFCYEVSHHQSTPCSGDKHPCPLKKSIGTRKSSKTTHIHRGPGDREIVYSISCYPIFQEGEVVAVVEIGRDITKDMNMQKMMMEQEKLASIGRLAAGVAHEINNPMTTILTTAMLIQEELDPGDPNYAELKTIADETLRCRKIVNSLLSFARQTKPEKNRHDINEIILEAAALTRKQAAFKDVALETDLSPDAPTVSVDKDQIQQVFINLALNAIEATDEGGKISLSSTVNAADNSVSVFVSDTGTGILEQDLERIFEPFFTTKETGTGLGLAITHGLVEQNEGAISVQSRVGEGTTFEIRFPLAGRGKDKH